MVSFPVLSVAREVASAEDTEDLRLSDRPALKASRWVASRTRRIFDCAVAAFALLLLLPVLAVCWLAVRLTSPGPVFFRQRRMGCYGREFELYKFRSMYWQRTVTGPSHTVHNDLRITSVGRLLRRYKLDELPQFWNVLKGDMSLVGPRPKLPHHELLHMPYRPGLTGQATLAFRHEEKMLLEVPGHNVDGFYEAVVMPIKAELDINYMERATFLDDVRLLGRTMVRCLHGSVDARRELRDLVLKYAPEYLEQMTSQRYTIPVTTALEEDPFAAELADDVSGEVGNVHGTPGPFRLKFDYDSQ